VKKTRKLNKPKPTEAKKTRRTQGHPFFGSDKATRPIEEVLRILRGGRYEWKNGTVVCVEKDLKRSL